MIEEMPLNLKGKKQAKPSRQNAASSRPHQSKAAMPPQRNAYAVLTCENVLVHIASFQRGVPLGVAQHIRSSRLKRKNDNVPNHAIETKNLQMLQRAHRIHNVQPWIKQLAFDHVWERAMLVSHLPIIQWLNAVLDPAVMTSPPMHYALLSAIDSSADAVVEWLLRNRPDWKPKLTMHQLGSIAYSGNLALLQCLVQYNVELPFSSYVMDQAAAGGQLNVLQYLHNHRTEGCTTLAMDNAAASGFLEVVQFLHRYRSEGCTTYAMDSAVAREHFQIVRFLHENRSEGCTQWAINVAARRGDLAIVEILCQARYKLRLFEPHLLAATECQWHIVEYLSSKTAGRATIELEMSAVS